MITKGHHYKTLFLDDLAGNNSIQYKVTKISGGYKIVHITHYICITKTKLTIFSNGSAKAVSKVDKNYHRSYQCTQYFDLEGYEIKGETTREELAFFKKLSSDKI